MSKANRNAPALTSATTQETTSPEVEDVPRHEETPHEETAAERKARIPKTADDQLRAIGERYAREAGEHQGALEKLKEREAVLTEKLSHARAAQARIELALGAPIVLEAEADKSAPSVDEPVNATPAPSPDVQDMGSIG